jgi:hypothetical protein
MMMFWFIISMMVFISIHIITTMYGHSDGMQDLCHLQDTTYMVTQQDLIGPMVIVRIHQGHTMVM